jgi:hypothetical protein
MAYYLDLSPYSYTSTDSEVGVNSINIGWLAKTKSFTNGVTSQEFQKNLLEFCSKWCIHYFLGYHFCQFCRNIDNPIQINQGEEEIQLGNGEIRVIGQAGIYAAPTLIYHYVVEHHYRPPDEFIEAILTGPSPGSVEHQALIKRLNKPTFEMWSKKVK